MAKLSVIIPCYNSFKYLCEMVDCCFKQTYQDWELIIVDDCSTDGTYESITEYTKHDNRVHVYQRDRAPKGSVTCRNIGFEHSTGDYIIHFDADDLFSDSCFEERVLYMDENKDCDYATFVAQGFAERHGERVMEGYYGVSDNTKDLLERFLTVSYPFSIWCNIYRRRIVEQYPWDEKVKVYSDFSYAIPMIFADVKHSFANNTKPDYFYRRFYSKQNMCASAVNQDKCLSTLYLFDKTLKSLEQREDSEIRKEQFLRFVVLHFERLVNGCNLKDISDYLNMLEDHYPKQITGKFSKVNSICKSKYYKWNRIKLEWLLYLYFGYPIYKKQLLHSIGKLILNK